jgi:hypothetical protein
MFFAWLVEVRVVVVVGEWRRLFSRQTTAVAKHIHLTLLTEEDRGGVNKMQQPSRSAARPNIKLHPSVEDDASAIRDARVIQP